MEQARETVRLWAEGHRQAVLYDDASAILMDLASGKRLKLAWPALAGFEVKRHAESQDQYLVLQFDDGTQIALDDSGGVAFAPSTANSGPVENLPAVVCLRDFLTLKQRVDHFLYDHPDDPPPRECLNLLMICIAILDGARAVGFDIGDLEGELEISLGEIERRTK
jgi:hypothetical protein